MMLEIKISACTRQREEFRKMLHKRGMMGGKGDFGKDCEHENHEGCTKHGSDFLIKRASEKKASHQSAWNNSLYHIPLPFLTPLKDPHPLRVFLLLLKEDKPEKCIKLYVYVSAKRVKDHTVAYQFSLIVDELCAEKFGFIHPFHEYEVAIPEGKL
jgi:hypothetical protein